MLSRNKVTTTPALVRTVSADVTVKCPPRVVQRIRARIVQPAWTRPTAICVCARLAGKEAIVTLNVMSAKRNLVKMVSALLWVLLTNFCTLPVAKKHAVTIWWLQLCICCYSICHYQCAPKCTNNASMVLVHFKKRPQWTIKSLYGRRDAASNL